MYNLIRSHRGSALIIWLIIVVLLTIVTTSFLGKILNLGKTSGGIGNSAQSYSLATGLIEEQLMDSAMTRQEPWKIATVTSPSSTNTGRNLSAYTGSNLMPAIWKWNSTFDPDWNIIGLGEPVQIVIPEGINWSNVFFYFRVPPIPGETSLTGATNGSGIILWTFGYSGASLYASGETEIFKLNDITWLSKSIASFNGVTNTGSNFRFDNFYGDATSGVGSNWAKCAWFQCTLKLSMIRQFTTNFWKSYPFLEYRIDFDTTRIPSQYMVIDSSAYVYGYLRSRQVRIQQITTNTAIDFALLQ